MAICVTARVRLLDVGEQLEADKRSLLEHVANSSPSSWRTSALAELAQQPTAGAKGELPQKRVYGSDFPFRDRGQLARMTTSSGGNRSTISPAFGRFSNVWGAQVMPFSERTFDEWPVAYQDLLPHYHAILDHIPFAGADDAELRTVLDGVQRSFADRQRLSCARRSLRGMRASAPHVRTVDL